MKPVTYVTLMSSIFIYS